MRALPRLPYAALKQPIPSTSGPMQPHTATSSVETPFNWAGPFPPRPPNPTGTSPFPPQQLSHSSLYPIPSSGFGRMPSAFDIRSTSGVSASSGEGMNSERMHDMSSQHLFSGAGADPWGQGSLNLSTVGTDPGGTPRAHNPAPRASSAPLSNHGGTPASAALVPRQAGSDSGDLSGRSKRRRRNELQQLNNKLAQQRYREKQKAKTRELQDQVDELQAYVKALEDGGNAAARRSGDGGLTAGLPNLAMENEALRGKLAAQATRLAEMEPLVRLSKGSSGGEAHSSGGTLSHGGRGQAADVWGRLEEDAALEYSTAVADLCAVLRSNSLPEVSILCAPPVCPPSGCALVSLVLAAPLLLCARSNSQPDQYLDVVWYALGIHAIRAVAHGMVSWGGTLD
jgi:hypothetical protein